MLLFDENLPARAVDILRDEFPGARHVKDFSLMESSDSDVWSTAKSEKLAVISKDDDFLQRALLLGQPPKVIIVKIGNCATRDLISFLRSRSEIIRAFVADSPESILVLRQ